jgi:type VI secretion system protein ImpH
MAYSVRNAKRPLIQRLQEEPYRFTLDQAVFLCNLCKRQDATATKLHGHLHFDLQAYEVADVHFSNDAAVITTNHENLLGIHSPLPVAYRESVLETKYQKRPASEEFLNIFNHRLLEISYAISVKRFAALQRKHYFQSLPGLLQDALSGVISQTAPSDSPRFSGRLWEYTRSLSRLESELQRFFGKRIIARQFVGAWRLIDPVDHTHLGRSAHTLGAQAALGKRVWDQTHSVSLVCWAETQEDFISFLPHAARWTALSRYIRTFLGSGHGCRMELRPPDTITPTCLDGKTPLGCSSWLVSSYNSKRKCDSVYMTVC